MKLFGLGNEPKTFEFKCSGCGDIHRGSPSFAYTSPQHYLELPADERDERADLTDDLCSIRPAKDDPDGDTFHFIRAILEVPIKGVKEPFCWGIWVSQSKDAFDKYVETFDDDQSADGSFGWLTASMPYYKTILADGHLENLPCDVVWGGIGERPKVYVHDIDHQLRIDQDEGISWDKAVEIATLVMHGNAA